MISTPFTDVLTVGLICQELRQPDKLETCQLFFEKNSSSISTSIKSLGPKAARHLPIVLDVSKGFSRRFFSSFSYRAQQPLADTDIIYKLTRKLILKIKPFRKNLLQMILDKSGAPHEIDNA
jgi:hypothetical protein